MSRHFFSGSYSARLDSKNRFVLPQPIRFGLIEEGRPLPLTLGLGIGGCLAIHRRSEMDKIVETFRSKQHLAHFQKFFTVFFSTLHQMECDKLGRLNLPPILKKATGIDREIVIAGVLNKIEIWPKDLYERNLKSLLEGRGLDQELTREMQEAFALLEEVAIKDA